MRNRTIRLAHALGLVVMAALISDAARQVYVTYVVPQLEIVQWHREWAVKNRATAAELATYFPPNPWPPCTNPQQCVPKPPGKVIEPHCHSCRLRMCGPSCIRNQHQLMLRQARDIEDYCRFPNWLVRGTPNLSTLD